MSNSATGGAEGGAAPRAVVVVASTRAAAGVYEDRSGAAAVEFLRGAGFEVADASVVADAEIGPAVRSALETQPAVLLTSGGTGLTDDDLTVETVSPLLDKELPGVTQEFFRRGLEHTPTAVLSRAVAGLAGRTFVMTLPGSPGGVKDGCAVLEGLLPHILELTGSGAAEHAHAGSPRPVSPTTAPRPAHPATAPRPPADPAYVAAQTGVLVGTAITQEPLEPLVGAADVMTDAMGALVRFDGAVRDHDGGARVSGLTYEAHPSAAAELERVCAEVAAAHPVRLYAAHRVGPVPIGELAFVVLAAAAHRGDAFAACQEAADRVKAEVPIWKEQAMADGTTQWVGIDGVGIDG